MAELKIKVDTRVSEDCYKSIKEYSDTEFDGNFSMGLRRLIEKGIDANKDPRFCKHKFESTYKEFQYKCTLCGFLSTAINAKNVQS